MARPLKMKSRAYSVPAEEEGVIITLKKTDWDIAPAAGIYLADIREIAPRAHALMEKISALYPERARKILGYAREEDRLRSLAAGMLLEYALGARKAGAVFIGEYGKPRVEGGPHFNISHSGDYVLLAAADAPVGIDIELWTDGDCSALADAAFHEDERALLGRSPSARSFFDLWTLKESYVKMLGTGLSAGTKSFKVIIDGGAARIDTDPGVRLYLSHILEGYSVSVCLGGPRRSKT
jgi:4'-phosphopantetheinyl transferase